MKSNNFSAVNLRNALSNITTYVPLNSSYFLKNFFFFSSLTAKWWWPSAPLLIYDLQIIDIQGWNLPSVITPPPHTGQNLFQFQDFENFGLKFSPKSLAGLVN